MTPTDGRTNKPRADARRNRERLLAAAASAFSEECSPTLDLIARRAGFGIGTLYRHFPTREALVEAVYRAELAALCESTAQLLAEHPPDEALHHWMRRYITFVATKNGMADALQSLVARGAVTKSETAPRLTSAIQELLDASAAAGTLRADVSAEDVTAALAGTVAIAGSRERQAQAARLVNLLMDGLRAMPRPR